MRAQDTYKRRFKKPFRHAWELCSAVFWLGCALYFWVLLAMDVIEQTLAVIAFAVCGTMFVWRMVEGWSIWRARSYLHGYGIGFMSLQNLQKITRQDELWLGRGYAFEPEHSQILYDYSAVGHRQWLLSKAALWLTGRSKDAMPEHEQGCAALHGLNQGEEDIYRSLKNFEGGIGIVGTTQAGKGVVQNTLIAQAIFRGDVVIFIDPKGGGRAENCIRNAARIAGREEPLIFTTDYNRDNVRINLLDTFASSGEIATRIVSVMPPSSDGTFKNFAWSAVDTVAQALIELKIPPLVRTLESHINKGINELLGMMLDKFIEKYAEPNWRKQARAFMRVGADKDDSELDALKLKVSWYENVLDKSKQTRTVENALKVFHHNKEHYSKITASLMPVFALLNNGDMEKILSPDASDPHDKRRIVTLNQIIEHKEILYVSLGSMQNADVANATGAMMLADLASIAGYRYKLGKKGTRICLFVDEVSNVVNGPLIELLNKGAEGGIYTTVAMQTMADLEERLGSVAAARKVLGNLNNIIALRTKDGITRDTFTETMGKTYITRVDSTLTTHADNYSGVPAYNAGASHKISSTREDVIPGEYYSMLPNCQYFANVSGGKLFKLRAPILIDADEFENDPNCSESVQKKTAEQEITEALDLLNGTENADKGENAA